MSTKPPFPSPDKFFPRLPKQLPDQSPDLQYSLEVMRLRVEALEIQNERLARENIDRTRYTPRLFWLMVVWLIAVFGLIVLIGLGWLTIANSVMIALISGTTINVMAMFGLVAKYLFRIPSNKSR